MTAVIEIIIAACWGCALAALSLWLIRRYEVRSRQKLMSVWLILAALIYVGFAMRTSSAQWWWTELAGVAVFVPLALLGLKYSTWLLAAGWAGHGLWDVGLHSGYWAGQRAGFVPVWYPGACLGFDLLIAGYLAAGLMRGKTSLAAKELK